jgi:hypothetical protein
MDSVRISIQDLQLLGVEASFLDELGGTEPMLEGGAAGQVPHPGLDESPEIARCTVSEFHDPAGLAFEKDDMPASDVACLHRVMTPYG